MQIKFWGFLVLYEFMKDVYNFQRVWQRIVDLFLVGVFLVRFKFYLVSKDFGELLVVRFLLGYNVIKVIFDYFWEIGVSILCYFCIKFNDEFILDQVQWCVIVFFIWDDYVKK